MALSRSGDGGWWWSRCERTVSGNVDKARRQGRNANPPGWVRGDSHFALLGLLGRAFLSTASEVDVRHDALRLERHSVVVGARLHGFALLHEVGHVV